MTDEVRLLCDKLIESKVRSMNLIVECLEHGDGIGNEYSFLKKEDVSHYKSLLHTLRAKLADARIALDAFIEAQSIFKEVLGYSQDVTLIETIFRDYLVLKNKEFELRSD